MYIGSGGCAWRDLLHEDVVALLDGHLCVVDDVLGLPRVGVPQVRDGLGGEVSVLVVDDLWWEVGLLWLHLVVEDEDAECGLHLWVLLEVDALSGGLISGVLLELAEGVVEGGSGVVDLVDDENVLADQVELALLVVDPLGALDGDTELLGLTITSSVDVLVQGEDNSEDAHSGHTLLLEECTEDTGRDETTTTDSDDVVWLELLDALSGDLAQLVHVVVGDVLFLVDLRHCKWGERKGDVLVYGYGQVTLGRYKARDKKARRSQSY